GERSSRDHRRRRASRGGARRGGKPRRIEGRSRGPRELIPSDLRGHAVGYRRPGVKPGPCIMAAVEDYYAVLGIDRHASPDEVKKAYRRLTLEFHPDRHPGEPEAQERFRTINQAYAVLGDA